MSDNLNNNITEDEFIETDVIIDDEELDFGDDSTANADESNEEKSVEELLEQENKEKKQKKLKVGLIAGIAGGVVLVLAGLIVFKLNRTTNKDLHITLAEPTPDYSAVLAHNDDEIVHIEVDENALLPVSETYNIDVNDEVDVPFTISTKLVGDESYKDYTSNIKVKYVGYTFGYDNVKSIVDENNKNSNNIIKIPDRSAFYEQDGHADFAVFEFLITVPDDFTTNDKTEGYIGIIPEFSFKIDGTEEEGKIITDAYEFKATDFSYLGDNIEDLRIGKTYTVKYIGLLPYNMTKDLYTLQFTMDNKSDMAVGDSLRTFNIATFDTVDEDEFLIEIGVKTPVAEDEETEETEETEKDKK